MTMTATDTVPQVGTVQHVQPGQLLLERNIRETKLDPEFVASIKELGVLEPIVAVLNDDGDFLVRFGHRRALAAVEAGIGSVPVYISGGDDLADAAEVERITRQHAENTHRSGLTAAEQVGVVEQLAAFAIKPDQIGKRLQMPTDQVTQAIAVAGSKTASKATQKYESITIDHAAVIAEFDDLPEVAEELTKVALDRPGNFEHAAQRLRDDRAREAKKAELREQLMKAQVKIVDEPDYYSGKGARRLTALLDKPGGKQLTPANHKTCPGHVGWVSGRSYGTPEIGYGCRDPKKHGHHDKDRGSGAGGRQTNDDLTPAEREKKIKARKLVIENNKAWASATTVRREWLSTFAKAKTAPKGAAVFIVNSLEQHHTRIGGSVGQDLACSWLGAKKPHWHPDFTALAIRATEGRALHIALVQVIAGFEADAADNMTWRRSGKTEWHGRYLTFLEGCGYPLSDVEKYAVSSKRPD